MNARRPGAHMRGEVGEESPDTARRTGPDGNRLLPDRGREPADEPGDDLGREADQPSDIPAGGWKDIAKRTFHQVREDRLQIVAAALGFYAMLAIFPALIAVVSIYGLVADPSTVQEQVGELADALPPESAVLIESQLTSIVENSSRALGWAAVLSILGALWAVSSGVQQLIKAVNIAYDEDETRGFFKLRGLALLFTLGLIVFAVISLALIVAVPPLLEQLDLGAGAEWAISIGRFVLLAAIFMVALAVLYRYAPDREAPQWKWSSWGAVIATVLWLIASILFTVFVTQFGSYQETYGALAGVIMLLLWFFITGFVVLIGAEINSEMEHQTRKDTTTGSTEPMGQRGAVKADTLPEENN